MGIKKNILYTSVLTTSNYIFPLIVYPYVSRVLEVANIGLCNYIDSIINYFILFSMMGITIVGTRQIAMDKANASRMDVTFSSLMALNGTTTLLAIIVLILLTFIIPELYANQEMMWFGAIKLISNFFLIEWFYKGIENFKFITVRTIVVKCFFVISVFLFVKVKSDYKIYYLLTALMLAGNAIINTAYSTRFSRFRFSLITFKPYIKAFFILGIYFFLTSLFTTFNTLYLGSVTNDTQVGFYTTATKLYAILLALYTGVTTVLMPRMSNLIAQNRLEEFKCLVKKSTSFLFTFSIPLIIVCSIFAPEIILLISGPGYEGAITPMRIIMPLMLIIGYEQIQVVQCLMPLKKDKAVMTNAAVGALIGISLNIILVPHLASVGSAVTWLVAECSILVLSQIILKIQFHFRFPYKMLFRNVLTNIPLLAILLILYFNFNFMNYWQKLLSSTIIVVFYFLIIEVVFLKNPVIKSLIPNSKSTFRS